MIEVAPLIRFARERAPIRRFEILQQWEGIVTELSHETFWADLIDLTNAKTAHETIEIPYVEIPLSDRELLLPGCVFYWSIGYETSPGGQIRRVSEIRTKRNPVWTEATLQKTRTAAKELYERLSQNDKEPTTESKRT
jgi:hypothetical protein